MVSVTRTQAKCVDTISSIIKAIGTSTLRKFVQILHFWMGSIMCDHTKFLHIFKEIITRSGHRNFCQGIEPSSNLISTWTPLPLTQDPKTWILIEFWNLGNEVVLTDIIFMFRFNVPSSCPFFMSRFHVLFSCPVFKPFYNREFDDMPNISRWNSVVIVIVIVKPCVQDLIYLSPWGFSSWEIRDMKTLLNKTRFSSPPNLFLSRHLLLRSSLPRSN